MGWLLGVVGSGTTSSYVLLQKGVQSEWRSLRLDFKAQDILFLLQLLLPRTDLTSGRNDLLALTSMRLDRLVHFLHLDYAGTQI